MGKRSATDADILLVEDNPGDVRLIREALEETPHNLHITRDGKEALDFLHQRNGFTDVPYPDIALLDLNLPRVDGIEVLEAIRSDPDLDRVRVIVLTSAQRKDTDIDPDAIGEGDFVTKPADPDEFMTLVRSRVTD